MKGNRKETEFGPTITLIDNNKQQLDIMYGGNLDLYFVPNVHGTEIVDKDIPYIFNIHKNDEFYSMFSELYQKMSSYHAFGSSSSKAEVNKWQRIDQGHDYPLVHQGIISWHSDEDSIKESSLLNISKNKEGISLEFHQSHPEDILYLTYAIRIRNSGSRYEPFNIPFMELYNNLCEYDFNYHQITLDEYMNEQKLIRKR